jgi:NADH-quinone oxidoreductase subunit M
VRALKEINARECLMLVILVVAVLWMGLYPKPLTDAMDASVAHLLQQASATKLTLPN